MLTTTPKAYSIGARLSGAGGVAADATVIAAASAVLVPGVPYLIIDHAYTRNIPAPIVTDDAGCEHGWMSFPIPPALDDGWEIFDTRKDRRTGWRRISIGWSAP